MEDRLAKFAKIVDAGSFTRAARLLHISQPALTSAVKKLERELQTELLIRGSHQLRLTPAGQIAYESAGALITETRNLQNQLQQVTRQKILLNLGVIDSLATMLFVQGSYLPELEQQAKVSLVVDNTSRLIELINHNELDIALVAQPHQLPASLQSEIIGQEPLIFVVHKQLLSEIQAQMQQRHLHQIMSYNQASHTHDLVNEHLSRAGITTAPDFYSTSPEIMLQLVRAQKGAAVLPYLLVKPWLDDGALVPVAIGRSAVINRTIVSLQRSGYAQNAAIQAILGQSRQRLIKQSQETNNL